jgi:ABC-type sugar transport system ATPase subunit
VHRRLDVLLLDEFTRGIDVGAKAEMLALVARLAAEGVSIIIVSAELEELVEGSDRVLVLARGRLIAELGRADASVERILRLVFEVEEQAGR